MSHNIMFQHVDIFNTEEECLTLTQMRILLIYKTTTIMIVKNLDVSLSERFKKRTFHFAKNFKIILVFIFQNSYLPEVGFSCIILFYVDTYIRRLFKLPITWHIMVFVFFYIALNCLDAIQCHRKLR